MTDVEQFFDDVFQRVKVRFSCIKGRAVHKIEGHYNQNTISLLQKFNQQGYECYFVVHSGGHKDEQITAINAVFLDFDCGRDKSRNYFPLSDVKRYKEEQLEKLRQFPHPPSYIIETRNGLHTYWLLESGATVEDFRQCEEQLITYFGADKAVKNPARLLRVPNTYWCKDMNNKYLTTITEHNGMRYRIQDIMETLQLVSVESSKGFGNSDRKKSNELLSIIGTKTKTATINVEHIKAQQIDVLQTILKPEPKTVTSNDEVFQYLKQEVSLHDYLGVDGDRFCCVFHNDESPSAGIFQGDSGDWLYKCHSDSCGVTGSIIELTKTLLRTDDKSKVLRLLRKLYRIEFKDSEWKLEQQEVYRNNLEFLYSDKFRTGYEGLYKRVRNYLAVLEVMNDLALEHITTENFTDWHGRPVFFASIGYIATLCRKRPSQLKQLTNSIGLLAYLGLINKLPKEEVPEPLLRSAIHEAAKKHQKKLVSFYSIAEYNLKTLNFALSKAKEFKELGLTMKGWGREILYRTFGEDEANRVYPQDIGKPIPQLNVNVTAEMEIICMKLIEEKGWTTEKEILALVDLRFKGQQGYKERQVKRIAPDMLNKYGLVKQRLNKGLKHELSIDVKGYPNVILKENEHERREPERAKVRYRKLANSNGTNG